MAVDERPFRIPPAFVFLATGLSMQAVAWAAPATQIAIPGGRIVARVLGGVGAAVALAGVIGLRRARTTVNPLRAHTAARLVVRGVYRYSRNPVYLGMLVLLAAFGVHLANPLSWIVVVLFWATMDRYQIPHEERALQASFGASFGDYAARVRRWIGTARFTARES